MEDDNMIIYIIIAAVFVMMCCCCSLSSSIGGYLFMSKDKTSSDTSSDSSLDTGSDPDYSFHQGMDSTGNDIKNVPGKSPEELKSSCDSVGGCRGFNTNGWLKSVILPEGEWSRWTGEPYKGLYVKS